MNYIRVEIPFVSQLKMLTMKYLKIAFSAFSGLLCLILWSCSGTVTEPKPVYPIPTEKQLAWHAMEQYAFIHFSPNTFTDLEWGFGDEDPSVFNPTEFDAEQWAQVLRDAGFKGLILTCKHHDGFCLWPSKYTEHSIKNSPYKDGKGDIVREVRDACDKYGLKFGIYVSPWDRNHPDYGKPEYITYYRNQLKELFENYGPMFEMWFDGANGGDGYYGGANEMRKIDKKVYYDWTTTLDMVRAIDSTVLFFSDAGPDIRWCGNEEGHINETNWYTIDSDTLYAGKKGISDLLNTGTEGAKDWIPAEVNTSIRPGWFYHESEDLKVKSPQKLFQIYMESVGRGSNMHLNIPPDRRGLINEHDVKSLMAWKHLLDEVFDVNLAIEAKIKASDVRGKSPVYAAENTVDNNPETYWATNDGVLSGSIELELVNSVEVKYLLVQEYIRLGQRIKHFSVKALVDGEWKTIGNSTTIGYKKILPLENVISNKIRIDFEDSRGPILISNIELF